MTIALPTSPFLLRGAVLIGWAPAFLDRAAAAPRFIVSPEPGDACFLAALGVRVGTSSRLAGLWVTARANASTIHDDVPNPWGAPFGMHVRGDVLARVWAPVYAVPGRPAVPIPQLDILGITVTRRLSWAEFATATKEKA